MEQVGRKLAAILSADVVGYSRLMEANDERTLGALKQHRREFFDPTVARNGGRIFKVMGDGFLVEFGSAVDAVRCAVEIQRGMPGRSDGVPEDRQIRFRIGVNIGDIIVDGDDFYGDGVNMAARLQGLARPGGIACSGIVRDQVSGKLELEFRDEGEHAVKNIVRPVHVYFIELAGPAAAPGSRTPAPAAADKPSVAILPFTNMSNDPEQEFFSDGITEDIITDLSKASGLFVLGRNTVFTYKGRAVNLEQAARELGVAYLLEGSVRKAGNRVRITAQLIDGATGGHLWAERYDGDLSDIFALQDEITLKIVSALKVKLLPEETRAIKAVPTKNVDAYTYYLRGRELLNIHLTRYYPLARSMFAKAAELDPAFAGAHAGMADCDSYTFLLRNDEAAIASIMDNSARAITLDPSLAEAHASRGLAFWLGEQPEGAEAEYRKALEIDPNLYEANYFFARFCRARGRHEEAARLFERAAEVRPADYQSLFLLVGEFFTLGRREAAERAGRRALERAERELASRPEAATAAILSATVLAYLGEAARAREHIGLALRAEPDDLRILYNAACAHAQLGDLDRALDLLEKVVPLVPPADRAYTREDPDFIPLHGHPRFERLLDDVRDTAAEIDAL